MVIPIFPAELHPQVRNQFSIHQKLYKTTQLFLPLVVCFNSPKPFPMWLRDSSPFSIKNYPTIGMGFPKSWGYQTNQIDHDILVGGFNHIEKYYGKDYPTYHGKIDSTPLKNMSSSVWMMTFPTECKNNPNVPNHQPGFDWNHHGDGDPPWLEVPWYFLTRDLHGWSPPFFWGVNRVTVASNRRIVKPIPRNHMEIPRKNSILSNLNPNNPMIIL